MSYYFSKTLNVNFENAINKVTESLKNEGFGILTEIDMKATLKKKLDVDMLNYTILGACNPPFAYKAVLAENMIGTMLPCNVVVQEQKDGSIIVAAVDPVASMMAIKKETLGEVANEVRMKLKKAIDNL